MQLLDEVGRGDSTRQGSRAEGGPRGVMLLEEAWPEAPQGVKGADEVGQRYEEKREGGLHGGGMQG